MRTEIHKCNKHMHKFTLYENYRHEGYRGANDNIFLRFTSGHIPILLFLSIFLATFSFSDNSILALVVECAGIYA